MPPEKERRDTGGDPQMLVECLACGNVYPGRKSDSELYPVGTDGKCICGGDDFRKL